MWNYQPANHCTEKAWILLFHLKEPGLEFNRNVPEPYVKPAYGCTYSVEYKCCYFNVMSEKHGRPQKKFKEYDLPAVFDEDNGQTHHHTAKHSDVDRSSNSKCLKAVRRFLYFR